MGHRQFVEGHGDDADYAPGWVHGYGGWGLGLGYGYGFGGWGLGWGGYWGYPYGGFGYGYGWGGYPYWGGGYAYRSNPRPYLGSGIGFRNGSNIARTGIATRFNNGLYSGRGLYNARPRTYLGRTNNNYYARPQGNDGFDELGEPIGVRLYSCGYDCTAKQLAEGQRTGWNVHA